MTRADDPRGWLDIARAELRVPPPGRDGSTYSVPDADLIEDPAFGSGPVLVWRSHGLDLPTATPSGAILDEFSRLALKRKSEFPQAVLAFARRYGVLTICRHGKPSLHVSACQELSTRAVTQLKAHDWDGLAWPYYEPLSAWWRYSRQLRAVLNVAGRLQRGVLGDAEDWAAITSADPQPGEMPDYPAEADSRLSYAELIWLDRPDFWDRRPSPEWWQATYGEPLTAAQRLRGDKWMIAHVVEIWLRYGRVWLEPVWHADRDFPGSRLTVTNLCAALAVGLLAATQGPLYTCDNCSTTVELQERRRPRAGDHFFCGEDCRDRGRKKLWARANYKPKGRRKGGIDSQPDSQAGGRDGAERGRNGRRPGG